MFLKQFDKKIYFGTDERKHTLSIENGDHFKNADVDAAASDLLEAYPDEAKTIERYVERLKTMTRA